MKNIRFLLLLFPALLPAQSDSTRLDTLRAVTISATRLPANANTSPLAVSALEGRYIREAQPQLTLQESLATVPGVFMLNDANFAQDLRIAIRGFGARAAFGIRGIKLLLDGIPESAPDGQAQLDNLDLATVGRIEVLRGASSGLYGNASGGVISISSMPAPEQQSGYVRLAGGRFGFRQLHAAGGGSFKKNGFRLSVSHLGLDGYRAHAAMRSTLANGQWTWAPDSSRQFKILLNYVNSPRADDPGALTLAQVGDDRRAAAATNLRYDAGESVQQGRIGLAYEKKWRKNQRLRLRGYSTWRDFENRLPFQNGGQAAFQRWFAGGGAQYDVEQKNWRFSSGVDLDRQADQRQRYDNLDGARGTQSLDQQETYTSAGLYTLAEWTPAPRWTISGGGRVDLVRLAVDDFFESDGLQSGHSDYRRVSPWGGLVLRLNRRLQAYANASTNFETPTLAELSARPDNSGGFNEALRPQRTLSAEIGLRGQWPLGFAWEVAGFRAVTRDELSPYELVDFPGRTFYRNAGETLRAGLELALRWLPVRGLELGLNYTRAAFTYRQYETPAGNFSGRMLPGLPQDWGMAEVQYRHARSGIFSRVQWRYSGRFFADDANAVPVDAYALVNLRLGYSRRHLEIFLGADNVFGAGYFNNIRLNAGGGRFYEPGSGAWFFGGVAWRAE
ncbi:MAG: TonB-dependent receptor [Lewinellaceae bacterium]|nr:TonB-dependent receptor [Lewinellaceae bacterium]